MDALILAGGENKRFPLKKSFLEINNKKIIESNVELLGGIFDRVVISTNDPELYFYLGVQMVGDIVKYKGPMAGIFSALINTEGTEIFVTACDMPFMKAELIKYILFKAKDAEKRDWSAVIPIFDKKPQPLFGIYSKGIIGKMEESLRKEKRSLRGLLSGTEVLYISEEEVMSVDPEGRSFININTPEDFEKEIGGEICLA
ncbi:MAG: molybdenum cofactor guanylyltransferase [Nitrospirota bacterium]